VNGEHLAAMLHERMERFVEVVVACDDAGWSAVTTVEGWPVAGVAQHVVDGLRFHTLIVTRMARGRALPNVTMAQIDEGNEGYRAARPARTAVLEVLHEHAARAVDTVGTLTEEELSGTALVPIPEERMLSTREFIERVMLPHIEAHMESVRATVSGGNSAGS
jgi:hypothetical protein